MTKKIEITFLGTSDAVPTQQRSHTSILLNYSGENILVDCGEGTQRQFRFAELNPCKITRILITHWHGDHVLGIPGILQTLALSGYNKTIYIYGPKGTREFIQNLLKTFVFVREYKIEVQEVIGRFLENEEFYIEAQQMTHGTPTNAYNFVLKGQIKIDSKKLEKAKIPSGPHLKLLKQGKNMMYKGKKYLAKDFTTKEADKKISFILDTSLNSKIVPFVKQSDLLICESSFAQDLQDKAKEYNHLTSKQAGEIAKMSKSKKLVLTHISQRYYKNTKQILDEAKKVFKNSELASDFLKLTV